MKDNIKELPCGCVMGTKDGIFYFSPCSPKCYYFMFTLKTTKELKKPIFLIEDKREG